MAKIHRAEVAFATGQRLKEIGAKLLRPNPPLEAATLALGACVISLNQLTDSLRTARNSYPNYPSLRKQLAIASDEIFTITEQVEVILAAVQQGTADNSVTVTGWGSELISLGQKLRLVQFVPSAKEAV